ncbi:twin-arginine translocase TatA/TatE family subunit [Paenibacillus spongiae]|uniref:Twin-arginine translocase TatA/TatE family subunit n=1 Tax=Paenibacillus spongiae TaxID=2909671 RepID=A0ABY5S3G2_9BACL|nr:twin-arginine translocase TatA/TatE family subunit [Paenibacillus spongiae]UVI28432.1 twin-arginine translocase TatA/TatE family subunit [Paenibacillus spongiae]
MPMNIGVSGVVLILLVALFIFGPSKLPQLGRAIGTTIKEFRHGTKELMNEPHKEANKEYTKG